MTDNQTGIPASSNEQAVVVPDEQIARMAKQIECMQAELERVKGSSHRNVPAVLSTLNPDVETVNPSMPLNSGVIHMLAPVNNIPNAFINHNNLPHYQYLPIKDTPRPPQSKAPIEVPITVEKQGKTVEQEEIIQTMKIMQQSIKDLQVSKGRQSISYRNRYLYPDVTLPPGFKVPKFDMYDGHSDPFVHLTKYLNRMRVAGGKEELLMAFFSHSLEGIAAEWFARQDISKWREFDDIANDFTKQFEYNVKMAPDLITLSNLKKKPTETFREYALRWREQAARVQPPMTEEDMVKYFIRAQDDSYYMHLLPMMGKPYSELLVMGEMVEEGVKTGRIVSFAAMKATTQAIQTGTGNFEKKKREDEVGIDMADIDQRPNKKPTFRNSLNQPTHQSTLYLTHPSQYQIPPAPYPVYNTQPNYHQSRIPAYQPYSQPQAYNYPQQHLPPVARPSKPSGSHPKYEKKQRRKFTSLGEPQAQLYERLKDVGMLEPLSGNGTYDLPPQWVDGTKYCAYHAEFFKHDTNECVALKHKIQDLIEDGSIQMREPMPGDSLA